MTAYFADFAWLPHGWGAGVRLDIGAKGVLQSVGEDASSADGTRLGRFVLPGMPNLHSHAFQRAMA